MPSVQSMMTLRSAGANGTQRSPLLVFVAAPFTGHIAPALFIAQEMIKRGFEAIFLTSEEFKAEVQEIGAEYYGSWDLPQATSLYKGREETSPFWDPPDIPKIREGIPMGLPRLLFDMEKVFIAALPKRSASMRSALELVHQRDPDREIIIINETASQAVLPFMYGAPLPRGFAKFPKVININIIPLGITSVDTAPFGPGLPPDSSESGRARNKLLYQLINGGLLKETDDLFKKTLKVLGCTKECDRFILDAWMTSYDATFQLCGPSMEYPRSDMHPSIRYSGTLPKKGLDPMFQYPPWWPELAANSTLPPGSPAKKKVIVVAQGTVNTDHTELVIPTMQAFAARDDVLVLAILGIKGATLQLPPGGTGAAPANNARVVDYLPYDAALEYADVFVNNAGYGGCVHGVNNGVPMVMAGETEDKAETAARADWAGFAVNLRTQLPTSEAVYEGVERIFRDDKYKLKAMRLMHESLDLDALNIIEKQIRTFSDKC